MSETGTTCERSGQNVTKCACSDFLILMSTELQQEMARSKERVFSELAEQQNQNAPILDCFWIC